MKKNRLKSRKLWAFIGTVITGALFPGLIPLLSIATPTYLGAQGAVDVAKAIKGIED